ncbi:UbiA family prenyltransferase [Hyphomicrobium sp. DY-1]|uniref:UbiA family prenyltransferase n=1 Tax=Hyphomicrobium sp. DY-1 TaxID=3075650 RepID=UPI0039C3DC6E
MGQPFDIAQKIHSPAPAGGSRTLALKPICLCLEGGLVRANLTQERLLAMLFKPTGLLALLANAGGGATKLRECVSRFDTQDAETLPYNEKLLEFLRAEKSKGHPIVLLATAEDPLARAVVEHLSIFDDVIFLEHGPSDKNQIVDSLKERFGESGFIYVGNDQDALAVWKIADAAIVVNASPAVVAQAQQSATIQTIIDDRPNILVSSLRLLRPHQWSKNLLVFVPLIAARLWTDLGAWGDAVYAFLSFCAIASSIYVINDIIDISSDRRHPRKRKRAVASGDVSIPIAIAISLTTLSIGLVLSYVAGVTTVVVIYALTSLSYSLGLKKLPLVDIFILAALYTLRVLAGGIAVAHPVSFWLLGFSGFTFLSLSSVKRTEELMAIQRSPTRKTNSARGYLPEDLPFLQMLGCSSTFASSVVLALFVGSSAASEQYRSPEILWLLVPLMLFWQCRLWLATMRGWMHDDPIVYAARDWVTWCVVVTAVLIMFASATGIVSFY